MPTHRDLARTELSRVWLIEDRAGPANVPEYEGLWKAGSLAWPQGTNKLERIPDPDTYGKFVVVDKILGEPGNPSLTISALYEMDLSDLMRLMKKGCDVDLQVHLGKCQDPQDFDGGWDKIVVLEGANITNYSLPNLGALAPSERAEVKEEVPFEGLDLYEIMPISFEEQASVQVGREVVDIDVCDSVQCGACGIPSNGCQKVFALTITVGGSPGLSAEIVYSDDGGATWEDTDIDTLSAAEDPNALACVGVNMVVVSNDSCSLHYANLAAILLGTEVWTEVATGFVALKCPNAIFSIDPRHTWIVGDGGYVYFTADPTSGVTVQNAGTVTVQNLTALHFLDNLHGIAVGAANALISTDNGGDTWALIVGPAVGVALNCCWMASEDEWWVGTADGKLWYTRDGGASWTEKTFPGSGAGAVYDIKFSTPTVGWMSHSTAVPAGRILRTINGGNTWYVAPEGNTSIPANDQITALAVCDGSANVVWGGGKADVAPDGIIVKGS